MKTPKQYRENNIQLSVVASEANDIARLCRDTRIKDFISELVKAVNDTTPDHLEIDVSVAWFNAVGVAETTIRNLAVVESELSPDDNDKTSGRLKALIECARRIKGAAVAFYGEIKDLPEYPSLTPDDRTMTLRTSSTRGGNHGTEIKTTEAQQAGRR